VRVLCGESEIRKRQALLHIIRHALLATISKIRMSFVVPDTSLKTKRCSARFDMPL
jgi:hypothetical protein